MIVGKMVDNMTWGRCIPTDSVKSGDDCPIFIHSTKIGAYIDSDKTNPHSWLVKVMTCQVSVIRKEVGV